ncbi:MAG: NAD(P)-binding protein, partial [Bdellovibrionales bacterium]|nr:NAD(P)-binding protein [Bdellovibrionales bacterium]
MPNPIANRHAFKDAPQHVQDYASPAARVNGPSVYTLQELSHLTDRAETEAGRCIACKAPACETTVEDYSLLPGCQLNHPPAWITAMGNNDYQAALALHNRTSQLGLFYGLLCPAPCEDGCTMGPAKGGVGAINIHEAEATLYSWAIQNGALLDSAQDYSSLRNGKRVAIIGSGVSGIEAADVLNRLGFEVHVFEKKEQIGGILRWEIPNYK